METRQVVLKLNVAKNDQKRLNQLLKNKVRELMEVILNGGGEF